MSLLNERFEHHKGKDQRVRNALLGLGSVFLYWQEKRHGAHLLSRLLETGHALSHGAHGVTNPLAILIAQSPSEKVAQLGAHHLSWLTRAGEKDARKSVGRGLNESDVLHFGVPCPADHPILLAKKEDLAVVQKRLLLSEELSDNHDLAHVLKWRNPPVCNPGQSKEPTRCEKVVWRAPRQWLLQKLERGVLYRLLHVFKREPVHLPCLDRPNIPWIGPLAHCHFDDIETPLVDECGPPVQEEVECRSHCVAERVPIGVFFFQHVHHGIDERVPVFLQPQKLRIGDLVACFKTGTLLGKLLGP